MRRLAAVLVFLLTSLASGSAALAQNITVDGSPRIGVLPQIITAFVVQDDVLPPGATDYYVFTLFDTGSTKVNLDFSTAASLGVTTDFVADIRINGLGAIDPVTLNAPIYADQAQADVPGITVVLAPSLDRTLIGAPVTSVVKAVIDYTKTITRGPYPFLGGENVEGPDITFYPAASSVGYTPALTLRLEALSANRYLMYNVSFNKGSASVATPPDGELNATGTRFMYDTGTTVTELTQTHATTLGLTGTPDFLLTMSDGTELPGYNIDSITMTGDGGVYTVLHAPVVVVPSLGGADAVIGSNLFSQVKLLFDGPAATLGISLPTANRSPVANAGADQTIEATGPMTSFTLDGRLSSDPDGDTLTYSWQDAGGDVVGESATVNLSRPLGTHVFTVTVTDPAGLTAEAAVSIAIRDTTPPALSAPPDITVVESDPLGTKVNPGQPSVNDICDPNPVVTNDGAALFPLGVTPVTWWATDASGNTSSAQQKITVVPGTPLNQLSNLAKLTSYSVASGGIAPDLQTSLLAKINAATAALTAGNPNAAKIAMQDLKALVNQIEAQTTKHITPPVAAAIMARANGIILDLGG